MEYRPVFYRDPDSAIILAGTIGFFATAIIAVTLFFNRKRVVAKEVA